MKKPTIAIIGAGLSGLVLARHLSTDAEVSLFEKSRGVSGRMSTRYAGDFTFDHGAQCFTARTLAFQQFLEPFKQSGLIKAWQPNVITLEKGQKPYKRDWFEPHYIAVPKMNALNKHLALGLNVELECHVADIRRYQKKWRLMSIKGTPLGEFDWVICAAPAPQTRALMPPIFNGHEALKRVKMDGCFTLMLGFDKPLPFAWHAAKVKNSPIEWITNESSKPERSTSPALSIQTHNAWAEKHLDDDLTKVEARLLAEISALLGFDATKNTYQSLHRWRYAETSESTAEPYLIHQSEKLAACGDWCTANRVEGAFTSGHSLAEAIIAAF